MMTGRDASPVLTDALALKRIKLLDVVPKAPRLSLEGGGFDADVALVTGELRGLIPDLIRRARRRAAARPRIGRATKGAEPS